MLTKLLAAATTAATLTLPAPAAQANEPTFDCAFASLQSDPLTGSNYEGVVVGYVVHDETGPVHLRCFVQVDGVPSPSAHWSGSGTGAAVVFGPASFEARDVDHVEMCAEATTFHGTTSLTCRDATHNSLPPREIADAICDITTLIGRMGFNMLGLVVIEPNGWVYVAGTRVWDCSPSVNLFSTPLPLVIGRARGA